MNKHEIIIILVLLAFFINIVTAVFVVYKYTLSNSVKSTVISYIKRCTYKQ